MSQGTTLVAFKKAYKAALAARPNLSAVQVLYAKDDFEGNDDHLQPDAIWLGDARTVDPSEIAGMRDATKAVEELYELDVYVEALKTEGETQEETDERSQQLLAEVQQELAETTRTSSEIQWAKFRSWEHLTGPLRTGHGSGFEVKVLVKARLTP